MISIHSIMLINDFEMIKPQAVILVVFFIYEKKALKERNVPYFKMLF